MKRENRSTDHSDRDDVATYTERYVDENGDRAELRQRPDETENETLLADDEQDRQREHLHQIVVTGRLKQNRKGSEIMCFNIPLGPMQLICIANIPEFDDCDTAPVYVKFKFDSRKDRRNGNGDG